MWVGSDNLITELQAQEAGMLRVLLFTAESRTKWVCFRFLLFYKKSVRLAKEKAKQ